VRSLGAEGDGRRGTWCEIPAAGEGGADCLPGPGMAKALVPLFGSRRRMGRLWGRMRPEGLSWDLQKGVRGGEIGGVRRLTCEQVPNSNRCVAAGAERWAGAHRPRRCRGTRRGPREERGGRRAFGVSGTGAEVESVWVTSWGGNRHDPMVRMGVTRGADIHRTSCRVTSRGAGGERGVCGMGVPTAQSV